MPTIKVPDVPNGPVTIRHSGAEPFTVTAKGGQVECAKAQVPSVLAAFTGAEIVESATRTPAKKTGRRKASPTAAPSDTSSTSDDSTTTPGA